MSARKTSLTERQSKNGTSKYVLERCASINEYYDIAFKVCMSVSGFCFFVCVFVVVSPMVFFGCALLKREPRARVFPLRFERNRVHLRLQRERRLFFHPPSAVRE